MKIRIKDNSVRFRLAQNEVIELVSKGETWSICEFGGSKLLYGIAIRDIENISCEMVQNKITAFIPKSLIPNWDSRIHRTIFLYS